MNKEKINSSTDKELERLLKETEFDSPDWQYIHFEFERRNVIKSRKLKFPAHVAAWASVVAALASIVGVWLSWSQEQKPAETTTQQTRNTQHIPQTNKK
jgi:hypothetical protein